MRVLVLAAVREELGKLDGDVVGVGPVVAAVRSANLLETHRPGRVVLIGTAGAYPGGPEVGRAIVSGRIGMSHSVDALGLAYVPRPPEPVESDAELVAALGLEVHHVLTVGAITTDAHLAERLADGWTVEHLEAFAVGLACQEAGIPFAAVLGIANRVGPDAHLEWLTHRDEAQRAARDAAYRLLTR